MAAGAGEWWWTVTASFDAVRTGLRERAPPTSVRYTGQMPSTVVPPDAEPRLPAAAPGPAPALRRGLGVLRLLGSRATPISAGTIARELGLPRSTTYELLTELAAAGFAVHLPSERRWGLGLVAFEIGSAYLRGEPLERAGRPVLARLCLRTGATAHLGVLHGAQTLYLAKDKAGVHGPTLVTEVGVRLPAALTATGLSILAHLPAEQVRALFPDRIAFVDRTGRGPGIPAGAAQRLGGGPPSRVGHRGRPGVRRDGLRRRAGVRPQLGAHRGGRHHGGPPLRSAGRTAVRSGLRRAGRAGAAQRPRGHRVDRRTAAVLSRHRAPQSELG